MNLQKLESQLVKAFFWVASLSLLVPLVIFKNLLRPYITSKMFFFEAIVLVLVGLWVFLLFLNPQKYKPRKSLLLISLLVFLGVILLSVIFSQNVFRSFWGNAERMEGFISFIFFGLFTISVFSVLRERPELIKKLILASLIISLVCALYPALQKAGLLFAPPGELYDRPGGSFGNPTFLSGYLLAHLFLGLWYFFQNFSKNKKLFTPLNISLVTIFIVDFIVFIWTQTRGSWLGFFAGLVVFAVMALFALSKKYKIAAGVSLLIIVALGSLFFVFRNQIKDSAIGQKVPIVGRLASISLRDSSSSARWVTWQWSLEWFKNKPIFGVGQDMFYSVFDDNYSVDNSNVMSERFDRAHNKFVDLLVMNGVVGFGAYIFLLGVLFWEILKKIRKSEDVFSKIAWMSLVSLLVSYMVHNFFVFDTPANSLIFYFLIGCLLVLLHQSKEVNQVKEIKRDIIPEKIYGTAVILVIALGSIFYFAIYKPYQTADLASKAANASSTNLDQAFTYYQQALDKNTFIYNEILNLWSDNFIKSLLYSRTKQSLYTPQSLEKYSNELFSALDRGEKRESTVDLYVYRAGIYSQMSWLSNLDSIQRQFYGEQEEKWYTAIAQKWPKRTDYILAYVEDSIYKEKYEEAERWLDSILERTPKYSKAVWSMGVMNLVNGGSAEEAFQYMIKATDLGYRYNVNNKSDILSIISLRIKGGNPSLFVQVLENHLKEYTSDSNLVNTQTEADLLLNTKRKETIINLLIEMNLLLSNMNYNKIAEYLAMAVKYNSEDPIYWSRLAAAYGKLHNKDGAIQAAQMAAQLSPGVYATDAAAFIYYVQNEQWDKLP
jgi:O-antigen ligase